RIREDEEVPLPTHARQRVFQDARKIVQVNRRISEYQELRQRQLAFAENAETGDQRLARVTLAHDGGGQRMETGLAIAPQIAHAGHYQGKQRRQKRLDVVADEK